MGGRGVVAVLCMVPPPPPPLLGGAPCRAVPLLLALSPSLRPVWSQIGGHCFGVSKQLVYTGHRPVRVGGGGGQSGQIPCSFMWPMPTPPHPTPPHPMVLVERVLRHRLNVHLLPLGVKHAMQVSTVDGSCSATRLCTRSVRCELSPIQALPKPMLAHVVGFEDVVQPEC